MRIEEDYESLANVFKSASENLSKLEKEIRKGEIDILLVECLWGIESSSISDYVHAATKVLKENEVAKVFEKYKQIMEGSL